MVSGLQDIRLQDIRIPGNQVSDKRIGTEFGKQIN